VANHDRQMHDRLGLNLHRDAWPTTRTLAAHEEAGVRWLQVHAPPIAMLIDRRHRRRHARALRAVLGAGSLRLVLDAPDDLSAGTLEHDRAFDGLLTYAAEAGAELVAYHGMNFADAADARARERAQLEECSLLRLLQRAHTLGVIVAFENLAPVHPSPPRLCHDPLESLRLGRGASGAAQPGTEGDRVGACSATRSRPPRRGVRYLRSMRSLDAHPGPSVRELL
jgi:sugar phosphate isomerase/epimerase